MGSFLTVDTGNGHRYMVKYASKGECRSREVQSMLTRLASASAQGADNGSRLC